MSEGKTVEIRPGLTKTIDKQGTGDYPQAGDMVQVHYTGMLDNGQVFDSSRTRGKPIKFRLGFGEVIKGWDLGVEAMSIKESATLRIPPEYGYGNNAMGTIPANSNLTFKMELVSATDDTYSWVKYQVLALLIFIGFLYYFIGDHNRH